MLVTDLAADEQFWAAECLSLGWRGLDQSPGCFLRGLCSKVPKRPSETPGEFVEAQPELASMLGLSCDSKIYLQKKKRHFFFLKKKTSFVM